MNEARDNPAPKTEDLLAHARFVDAVARGLSADPATADDIAQDAWLSAIERPPASALALRAWFGTVSRHYAMQNARAAARRRTRERRAARPESLPDTIEVVLAEERKSLLVREVLALEEPYRAVIIARFFRELTPSAIALRDGVPLETVKTRLKRGLALLRERCDRGDGGFPADAP